MYKCKNMSKGRQLKSYIYDLANLCYKVKNKYDSSLISAQITLIKTGVHSSMRKKSVFQ